MGGVVPLLVLVLNVLPFLVGIIQEGDDHGERNGLFLTEGFFFYLNTRCQKSIMGGQKSDVPSLDAMGCPGGACLG